MKTSKEMASPKMEVNKSNFVMVDPQLIVADEKQNPRYEKQERFHSDYLTQKFFGIEILNQIAF